jgi:hypothetical protein
MQNIACRCFELSHYLNDSEASLTPAVMGIVLAQDQKHHLQIRALGDHGSRTSTERERTYGKQKNLRLAKTYRIPTTSYDFEDI